MSLLRFNQKTGCKSSCRSCALVVSILQACLHRDRAPSLQWHTTLCHPQTAHACITRKKSAKLAAKACKLYAFPGWSSASGAHLARHKLYREGRAGLSSHITIGACIQSLASAVHCQHARSVEQRAGVWSQNELDTCTKLPRLPVRQVK